MLVADLQVIFPTTTKISMSKLIVYFTYLCDFECNNNLLTANHLSIKRKNNSTQGQKLVLPPESKETLFPV